MNKKIHFAITKYIKDDIPAHITMNFEPEEKNHWSIIDFYHILFFMETVRTKHFNLICTWIAKIDYPFGSLT